jgi:hypothetical protein
MERAAFLDALRRRIPNSRSDRLALLALVVILGAGGLLRLALMRIWRPAFLGYPDTGIYLTEAINGDWWADPIRTGGYPIFLELLHGVAAKLSLVTLVQHGLGLATALLLYGAVRRVGVGRWPALIPLVVVSLSGPQIMIEHAILTEGLFTFLQAAALYAAVRSLDGAAPAWALSAGLTAALAATVRPAGLILVPVIGLWLLLARSAPAWRGRIVPAAVVLASAAPILLVYAKVYEDHTGSFGLTRHTFWYPYSRVGPFADCSRFTPPEATRVLCERTPKSRRPGPEAYLFHPATPGVQRYGGPLNVNQPPGTRRKLTAFARVAVVHQPLDYLEAVGRDLWRFVSPERGKFGDGLGFRGLMEDYLLSPMPRQVDPYYRSGLLIKTGYVDEVRSYQRRTTIKGPVIILLLLFAAAGPFIAQGRLRRGAILFAGITLLGMLLPLAVHHYDVRYSLPLFGPLAAAAGIGVWAAWLRARPKHEGATPPAGPS